MTVWGFLRVIDLGRVADCGFEFNELKNLGGVD
jgi:hypothetical protein